MLSLCLEKTAYLKQAKDEADKEVAQFRAQKEAQFQDYIRKVRRQFILFTVNIILIHTYEQHAGSTDEYTKQLEADTVAQISVIQQASSSHVPEVIKLLLDSVTKVSLVVEKN